MNKKIITYAIITLVILQTICVLTLGMLAIKNYKDEVITISQYRHTSSVYQILEENSVLRLHQC